ncbi:MAG: hypothetical protein RR022_02365 [Angelakisella sp.]
MMLEEDVRIYQNDEDDSDDQLGEGERSAASFLRHKENGNLAKCRELGQLLASTFADEAHHLAGEPFAGHKQVLMSFLISDELAGIIFDQLLQKSALSVFQQTVEQLDRSLFTRISDSAAYTLYILDDRNGDEHSLAATFAELCGQEGNAAVLADAVELIQSYRKLCADIISSYNFEAV